MMIENTHPNVSPLTVMWSLCIEEHFYIIWGILFYFIPIKYFPKIAVGFIIMSLIVRYIYNLFGISTADILTNIDLFAFGGLLAFYLSGNKEKIEFLINNFSKKFKVFVIIFIVSFIYIIQGFTNNIWLIFQPFVLGALFTILLAIFIPENSSLRISDNNIFSKWGRITYGLYLFHIIVINLFIKIFEILEININTVLNSIMFFLITFFITIIISRLSYNFFEKPFLKLKKYFYQK
jgi:peptidoglycan/LPS O-acetylase OafA/YrhL